MESKPVNIIRTQNITIDNLQKNDNAVNQTLNKKNNCSIILPIIISLGFTIILCTFLLLLLNHVLKNEKDGDKKVPVIFDVDEGGDDMLAFTIAKNSKKYKILGITTVCSNYYGEDVAKIWLRFLEYMGFDDKVYLGEEHPIKRKSDVLFFAHDYDIEFPETSKTIEEQRGVDFMYKTIKNYNKKVTLFLLGPVTNFAKAYQKDSTIVDNIEEIIIMGGSMFGGNVYQNENAEYNCFNDADAMDILINSGAKVKIFGFESRVEFNDNIYKNLLDMNTRSSILAYHLGKGTFNTWGDNFFFDPVTVLYYLNNELVTLNNYYIEVNITDNPENYPTDYGTMYFYKPSGNLNSNAKYTYEFDEDSGIIDLKKYLKMY